MQLKKGGRNALLYRGVDLPGNLLRDCGGVFCNNLVWVEDSGVSPVEGVRLHPQQ